MVRRICRTRDHSISVSRFEICALLFLYRGHDESDNGGHDRTCNTSTDEVARNRAEIEPCTTGEQRLNNGTLSTAADGVRMRPH